VFDEVPGAGPSFPFEVIATNTAAANVAAPAAHKLSLTPKPWVEKSSSESSPEVSGKDEWIPDSENSGEDDDDDTGGDTEGYREKTPATTPTIDKLSSRSTGKASATTSRVMMQRSDSVESYFRPPGHVANSVEVPECSRGDFSDANKLLLDGWLDKVDRQDKYDLSWTMVDPQPLLGRTRLKGLNEAREFGVWQHVAFVKTALLEGKYRRLVYQRPCVQTGRKFCTMLT
jgi:hypothetical protein